MDDRRRRSPGGATGGLLDVGILSAAWVALVYLAHPAGDFPLNDDWVYGLGVRWFLDTGRFQVPAFSNANVGPQILWGVLFAKAFGFSFDALRASTLVLGLVGVVGVYAIWRDAWHDRRLAVVAGLGLAANPLYFGLACTFMTDVPFVALEIVASYCIVRGLRRRTLLPLVVGLVLATMAMMLRQFGIVVFIAFAAALVIRDGLRVRTLALAVLPLVVAGTVYLGFDAWLGATGRKLAQGGFPLHHFLSPRLAVKTVIRDGWDACMLLGLSIVPQALYVLGKRETRVAVAPWTKIAIAATVLIGGSLLLRQRMMPLQINMLAPFGLGPFTTRDTLVLGEHLPPRNARTDGIWFALTVAGVFGTALLATAAGRWATGLRAEVLAGRRRMDTYWKTVYLVIASGAYATLLLLIDARGFTLFDRYLIPLVAVAGLALPMLASAGGRPDRSGRLAWYASIASIGLMAAFTTVAVRDYFDWNRVRWDGVRAFMRETGVSPSSIDAGYEFDGWYLYSPHTAGTPGKSPYWVVDDRYVVSFGPMDGYRRIRTWPVRFRMTGTSGALDLLERIEPRPPQD